MPNNSYERNAEGRTPRQQEAFDLRDAGLNNRQIADRMGITIKRVWMILNPEKRKLYNNSETVRASNRAWSRRKYAEFRAANPLPPPKIIEVDMPETPRQQEAYDLFVLDLPIEEIAQRMGLKSSRGVWSLLHHTKRRKYFGKGKAARVNS